MYGQALHRLGRLDEAAAALETALRGRQVSPAAVAEYGHVLMKLGRHAEAASAYRQAIAMGREDLTANLERAERGAAGEGKR
jgi:Flp pilus assembly protein TadD